MNFMEKIYKKGLLAISVNFLVSCDPAIIEPFTPSDPPKCSELQIGDESFGGYIVQVADQSNGNVCKILSEQAVLRKDWGCSGSEAVATGATSQDDGADNTQKIIQFCNEPDIAATYCSNSSFNGQIDWYLPASNELLLIYNNRTVIEQAGFNFPLFSTNNYWSSTESSATFSKYIAFSGDEPGSLLDAEKLNAYNVVCLRSFTE